MSSSSASCTETPQRIAAATELFEQLEAANGANGAFGNIRYWLTDLAVSLLTLSERNANEARDELDRLSRPARRPRIRRLAADIARETDAYMAKALEAVDAYTDDNRVIGNTLLAAGSRTQQRGRGAARRS